MNHQVPMGFTQREFEVIATILHHVSCYNGRRIVGVKGERLKTTVGFLAATNLVVAVDADIAIDGVEFGPARGRSA